MYNRDSRIMRRLLGKTSTDPSTADLSASSQTSPSAPILYRPTRSQNAVYSSNAPIHCLDVSPDKRSVALAGPHILKTLRLDDSTDGAQKGHASFQWHDGLDLRAAITSQASTGSGSRASLVAEQLSIRDVKWHGNSNFFTACANGRIFAYDLARMGTGTVPEAADYIQIQEDSRQVNTLDVNPHLKSWLLSGSQDGVARVFDVSNPWQNRSGFLTFRQRFQTLRCIDSVREVKWSPVVGHEMACCTEAGVVLKWDVRQPGRPLLRINAHEKACSSIAWHPDGIHLISAGWDSKLHVWDLSNHADKRQKPKWTIPTPAPVSCVAWRPGLWSATAQSKRVAQVSVTYDENTNRRYGSSVVHIWDLARPTLPYREIDQFEGAPTALHWLDQDLLWTVGHDGHFHQCDVAFSARVMERQTMSTMAFSPKGDAIVFLDERPQPHRPRLSSMSYPPETIVRSNAYGTNPSTPMLSVSKSDSEEDVGSFLGSKRRTRKRRPSGRGVQPVSTTPPSGSGPLDDGKTVLGLDQALKVSGTFRSTQAMAFGHIPAAKSVDVYQYLTSVYLETMYQQLPHEEGSKPLVRRIGSILEEYAKAAEMVSYFRLAQTWRIIAFAMDLLLKRRGQYHLETRISRFQKLKIEDKKSSDKHRPGDIFNGIHRRPPGEDTQRRSSGQFSAEGRLAPRSLLSEEIESTSNVATPLARPVDAVEGVEFHDHYHYGKRLTPIMEPESLSLGSAAHGAFKDDPRRRLDSEPISVRSHESDQTQISSTEGYDFYDTEQLVQAMEIDKHAHRTDHSIDASPGTRPSFARYDTGETYGMFSISGGTKSSGGTGSESTQSYGSPKKIRDSRQDSQGSLEEYHSRIRGEELGESPTKQRTDRQRRGVDSQDGADEMFMISQTTADLDESFPSQTSMPSQESGDMTQSSHQNSSSIDRRASDRSSSPLRPPSLQYSSSPMIIDNDYLPWEEDAPYPYPLSPEAPKSIRCPLQPLDPYAIIQRALEFETRTSALNASAMVLLLKPLTPEGVVDSHQASAILRQHHSRLMRMSLFTEASLLRKVCLAGWPAGLPEWGDSYQAIYNPAQQNIKVALYCTKCRKPRNKDDEKGKEDPWVCRRCKDVMAPCAVCGHREPEIASSPPNLDITDAVKSPLQPTDGDEDAGAQLTQWWFCPTCRHGGHASCLTTWHSSISSPPQPTTPSSPSSVVSSSIDSTYSDGCCPLDGCGHACLPGRYRHESSATRSDELGRVASASALAANNPAASSPSLSDSNNPAFYDKHGGERAGGYSSRRSSAANSRRSSPHRAAASSSSAGLGGGGSAGQGSVKSDGHEVGQSRAVGVAREMVKSGIGGSGILSSSPSGGSTAGGRERRKSVKFAKGSG